MSDYYDTALIALRALEQSRLDAGVSRDQAVRDAIKARAEILRLTDLITRPKDFPADWRDQIRKLEQCSERVMVADEIIKLIVSWQAAAKD